MGQRQREPRGWALTPRLIRINGLTRVNIWNGECCVAVHALQFPSEESVSFVKGVLDSSTIPYLYSSGNHDWHFEGLPGSSDDLRAEWREKSLLPLYGKRGNSLSFSYSSSRPEPVWVKSFIFTRNSHNMPFPQAAGTRHTGARTRRAACALSRSTTLPTRSPRSSSVRTAQRQGKTLLPPGKVSHLNKRVRKDDFIQTGSGQTEGILNGKGPFSAEFFLAQACSSSPAQPPVVLLVHIPLFLDELQVRESGLSPTFCLRNDQFTKTGSGQP